MSKWIVWEYLVLQMSMDRVEDNEMRLTNLGGQGWEVVAVAAYNSVHTIYLKREKTKI